MSLRPSTLLLLSGLGVALVAPGRASLLRVEAERWVRWPSARHSAEARVAELADRADDLRRLALDPEAPAEARIGAAEILRIAVGAAADDGSETSIDASLVEPLVAVARDLAGDPVAASLAVAAARMRRVLAPPSDDPVALAREEALRREVFALAHESDPSNGWPDLVAAACALEDGNVEDARVRLSLAADRPVLDDRLRPRATAALLVLERLGWPRVEAEAALLLDGYGRDGDAAGALLDRIAHDLGRADARELLAEAGAGEPVWLETFAQLDRLGERAARRALLRFDAALALHASEVYLDTVRSAAAGGARPIPGPLADPLEVERLCAWLRAEGLVAAAEEVMLRRRPEARAERLRLRAGQGSAPVALEAAIVRSALHALLLPWIALSLASAALLRPWRRRRSVGARAPAARRAPRRRVATGGSLGIDVAAGTLPFLVTAWWAASMWVGERAATAPARAWLFDPPIWVFFVPLVGAGFVALAQLAGGHRSVGAVRRRVVSFLVGFAGACLLLSAATAPFVLRSREEARRELEARLVDAPALSAPFSSTDAGS